MKKFLRRGAYSLSWAPHHSAQKKLSFHGGSRLLCAAGQDDHCNPAYDQSAADGRMHDLTPGHFDSNRNRTGIKSVPLASWNGNEQRQNTEYDKD